jgi:hypothetical protein
LKVQTVRVAKVAQKVAATKETRKAVTLANNALANPLTFAALEHVEPDDLHA